MARNIGRNPVSGVWVRSKDDNSGFALPLRGEVLGEFEKKVGWGVALMRISLLY